MILGVRDGDDEEDGSKAGTDDLDAFFPVVEPVIDVLNTKGVKDGVAGVLEINAMLGEVLSRLGDIPLKFNCHGTGYQ